MPGPSLGNFADIATGGKIVRKSNWWGQIGNDSIAMRPPKGLSVNENNVALPASASLAALALGATGTLTLTAQRDCIVRDLVLTGFDAAAAVGSAREGNFVVSALTVAGENCFAGNGEVPGTMFAPECFNRPQFDMPVKGGTAVVITVINRSLSVAGTDISAGMIVD